MDETLRFYQPHRRVTEGNGDTRRKEAPLKWGENNQRALSHEFLFKEMLKLRNKVELLAVTRLLSLIFLGVAGAMRETD